MSRTFQIADRPIGPGHPVYIIAELSANHNQDFDQAVRILEAARDAGADASKSRPIPPTPSLCAAIANNFRSKAARFGMAALFTISIRKLSPRGSGSRNSKP